MSSSDDPVAGSAPLEWSAFTERQEPPPGDLLSPASEVAAVLQRYRHDLDEQRATAESALVDTYTAAAEQAALLFHLAAALDRHEEIMAKAGLDRVHRQFRALQRQMARAIERTGLRVVDPVGRGYAEISEMVQVIAWRHGPEYTDEVVAETIEPIVCHHIELMRPGRVIMGAPEDKDSE